MPYFFDVGDGKILHIGGQDYYAASDPSWPNTVFEIVSTVDPPLFVGIFCYGRELSPRLKTAEYSTIPDVARGLSEGSLDRIEADIVAGPQALGAPPESS